MGGTQYSTEDRISEMVDVRKGILGSAKNVDHWKSDILKHHGPIGLATAKTIHGSLLASADEWQDEIDKWKAELESDQKPEQP